MNRLSSQSKRDITALLITLLLYTPLLFWWHSSNLGVPTESTQTILINIENFQCKEESIVEEEQTLLEERLIDDELLDSIDELMQEPPKIEPQPLTTKPKPIIKEKIKPKKIVKKKRITQKPIKKPKKSKRITKTKSHKKASTQKRVSNGEKSRFLTKVKRAINSHKIYPKMAKRRGLQGSVKVSFTITTSGGVTNIILKGSKLFTKATKRAIDSSFPIDTRGVALPITLNLTVNYRLSRGG